MGPVPGSVPYDKVHWEASGQTQKVKHDVCELPVRVRVHVHVHDVYHVLRTRDIQSYRNLYDVIRTRLQIDIYMYMCVLGVWFMKLQLGSNLFTRQVVAP